MRASLPHCRIVASWRAELTLRTIVLRPRIWKSIAPRHRKAQAAGFFFSVLAEVGPVGAGSILLQIAKLVPRTVCLRRLAFEIKHDGFGVLATRDGHKPPIFQWRLVGSAPCRARASVIACSAASGARSRRSIRRSHMREYPPPSGSIRVPFRGRRRAGAFHRR